MVLSATIFNKQARALLDTHTEHLRESVTWTAKCFACPRFVPHRCVSLLAHGSRYSPCAVLVCTRQPRSLGRTAAHWVKRVTLELEPSEPKMPDMRHPSRVPAAISAVAAASEAEAQACPPEAPHRFPRCSSSDTGTERHFFRTRSKFRKVFCQKMHDYDF